VSWDRDVPFAYSFGDDAGAFLSAAQATRATVFGDHEEDIPGERPGML
jgi:hypothetical protein